MGCRSMERGQQAISELAIAGCSTDRMILHELDLSSFNSVRRFAEFITKENGENGIDILINNAGIMLYPKFKLTEDGHELTWQTNYLGHFLLTELLMPLLKKAKESRIVNVSALAHYSVTELNLDTVDRREGWDSRDAYSRSKLAQVRNFF
jgi:NAD(P)-dependent dehydrogenase (short-subunit alcohol dehydrogenase family)